MTALFHLGLFVFLVFCLTATESYKHGAGYAKYRNRRSSRRQSKCDPKAKYREADGSCNNLQFDTTWGSTNVPLQRILLSAYDDGVSTPRTKAKDGSDLPTAREVSVKCHPVSTATADVTFMVMQWGQFLDHDIALTPHAEEQCPCDSTSSDCFSIPLKDDEFFKNRECMQVVRSEGTLLKDDIHVTPVRQQTNAITSYIDASNVYGSSDEETAALRGSDGELKDHTVSNEEYLPEGANSSCRAQADEYCFLAGDGRVNEQPGLTAMHTIFMREHNRIARYFRSKKQWDDEKTFQETRKIVGAMMQYITYNEFLPIVLGPKTMKEYSLESGRYKYDKSIKANAMNSFATAAYRFGHSLIPEGLHLPSGTLEFKTLFFSPSAILSSFNEIASAAVTDNSMAADRFFSHSVSRHLFETQDGNGFDLVSLNIQRGRDHGLPSYTEYRKICNLNPITLTELFNGDSVAVSAYSDIEDVDLFTGGMAEKTVDGGLVGPTFACLLGNQFHRLKRGDRFFFENTEDSNTRFTQKQHDEIRKVLLSKIICENTENNVIQSNVFLPKDSSKNSEKKCDHIQSMNLDAWMERPRKGRKRSM